METTVRDMLDNLLNDRQSDAVGNFEEIMNIKITDALDTHKKEIASSLGKENAHTEE